MTALLYIALGILAAAVAGMITFGAWWHSSVTQRDALRDVLDGQRTAYEAMKADRDGRAAQADALTERNRSLSDRLSVAESQRNAAWEDARSHVVEQIKASGVADAAHLVNDILSRPLPGSGPATAVDVGSKAGPVPTPTNADGVAEADRLP